MSLTDLACRTAKSKEKQYKLTDGRGLCLIVHQNGSKYWSGAYRFLAKQKSLSLGVYPEVTLLQARENWEIARKLLKAGSDPSAVKQVEKAGNLQIAQQTFELVAREWHKARFSTWKAITAQNNIHRLETDIFPQFGALPVSTITPQQVLAALRKIEARGALELSSRTCGLCSRVFNFAIACGYATNNPAAPLKDVLQVPIKGNFAAIEVEELPAFIQTLTRTPDRMFIATRVAIWLMMHTFVRTGELIAVPWSEVDLDKAVWTIPGVRMKMGRDHVIPLSRQSLALFKEMLPLTGKNHYVFPNQHRPAEHMSDGAILALLRRLGYAGKMTGHGFRSLAMGTIKQELGYLHEIIDLQLAHAKGNKVDAAYDRAKFLNERTKMMQDWSDYIDQLASVSTS
ncbi:tyrosine-type recombinase/integrase [Glaciimonas immobilis]|uniref:Integrase n=1 Tax=Glaciimonas immobilis TaxID=728004 RepID=A0A840RNS7_9BURK|nr:integrase arm-type DNA-binding domain-containing protein [Glaciimonas immobilis]KAF3999191.1 tyrosine-type recombinase/integrase [Glaciimonas immobilis]MBB5198646.1 integrase [Glaciimonas immobilis]